MRPWRDHLAWSVAFASGLYMVCFLLTRQPAIVEVQLEFDDRMLRATATVGGIGSLLKDRLIWARQENHTARNLTVHPSTGNRCEESFVFASSGESIHLELLREPEEAERIVRSAYFDSRSASCLVPLSYLGLPGEGPASIEDRGKRDIQVQRGLLIGGPGWVRTSSAVDVLASDVVAAYSEEACRLVQQGMETLKDWNIPPSGAKPLVVLLPKGAHELSSDFRLQDEGVYVVEVGERGPLSSTIFRDLARAACQRIARIRPTDEQVIWNSLSRVLAARIAVECSLHDAEEGLKALESRYAVRPREYSLHVIPEDPAARWRLENVVGPVYWNGMLRDWPRDGNALRDLFVTILGERRGASLREAVGHDFGEEIAAHVEAFLLEGRVQIDRTDTWHAPTSDSRRHLPRDANSCSIVYSGMNAGFLDNCGCSISQHGGLSRKVAAVKRERRIRERVFAVDLGDALAGSRDELRRTLQEQEAIFASLADAGYDVLVPGAKELSLDKDWFAATSKQSGISLVAANILERRTGSKAFDEVRVVERGGLRVAIIGLVEIPFQREWYESIERSVYEQYQIDDPILSLAQTLATMPTADVCVVAGTIHPRTTSRILEMEDPRIDLVLSSVYRFAQVSGEDEQHIRVQTRAHKGMYGGRGFAYTDFDRFGIGRVDIETAPRFWCAFSDISLAPEAEEDPVTKARLVELARRLAGQPETWRATPLTGFAAEQAPESAFVGSERCMTCHPDAAAVWRSSAHSHAYATLAKRGKESDPACLRCHTTGFLLLDGFSPDREPGKRALLTDVGCETCHGPGSLHVQDSGSMRTEAARQVCVACHDRANSPGFRPETKLSLICIPASEPQ